VKKLNKAELIKDNIAVPAVMTPYKASVMMKTAGKISSMIVSIPDWLISWDEMEIILDMVRDSIKRCRNMSNEKAPTD